MWNSIRVWIDNRYHKIINSIAFYPALIAFLFLIFSYFSIVFDFSPTGRQIKSHLHWLRLKDASTARSIISSIVSGIISLAVFSFSLVMIILSQTASQMSNRILDKLIGNRFQQIVLGFYIGTIVFALFLLSTIRDVDSGIYVPAISTYLLIVLTIGDIFLFIYFLHFITQSIKYEVIIEKIFDETYSSMEKHCTLKKQRDNNLNTGASHLINTNCSGVFEGFNRRSLLQICDEKNCTIQILKPAGTFLLKDTPVIKVSGELPENALKKVTDSLYIHNSESVERNYFYGFRQLMEVAVKALSPGINDPGTAVQCVRALSKLYAYRVCHFPANVKKNKHGQVRIITREWDFEEMFAISILPIWDYGKNDRLIQRELHYLLAYIKSIASFSIVDKLFTEVSLAIESGKL